MEAVEAEDLSTKEFAVEEYESSMEEPEVNSEARNSRRGANQWRKQDAVDR